MRVRQIVLVFAVFMFLAFSLPAQSKTPENLVLINWGTFTMGSPANEQGRSASEVQRKVALSSFYMGKYEVTQKEYEEIMGTNPSVFKGQNLPVDSVSWYNAVEYCNKRSQKEGLDPAYTIDKSRKDSNNKNDNDSVKWVVTWNRNTNGYRLPTEAEWEYACRAETTTPFSTGENITTDQANYNGESPYNNNAIGENRKKTTPVGNFSPNPWGLYDMHGNVFEWCWDWFGDYSNSLQTNPAGAVSGIGRLVHGGSWYSNGQSLRSAYRISEFPYIQRSIIGFRVVRTAQ